MKAARRPDGREGNARPGLEAGRANGSGRTDSIVTENGYDVRGLWAFVAMWWVTSAVIFVMEAVG